MLFSPGRSLNDNMIEYYCCTANAIETYQYNYKSKENISTDHNLTAAENRVSFLHALDTMRSLILIYFQKYRVLPNI